jgi:hypothetical protein
MALTESDIKIIIAAELKKQGFKDSEKAVKGLTNNFKKLGIAVGVAFSARALFRFAKESVALYAAEEKAVKQLTTSLGNLGFAYNVRAVEEYLEVTEKATLVTKDDLRPAFVNLLSATMNSQKSMELLTASIDIATATGSDLGSVARAVTRAFNGNFSSLGKLQSRYTTAELDALGFDRAMKALNEEFKGAAAANLDTYSGKIGSLELAANKAKEEVGKGLLAAIEQLGSGDYDEGLQNLVDFGTAIGDSFKYAVGFAQQLKAFYDFVTLKPVQDFVAGLKGVKLPEVRGGVQSPTQLQLAKEEVQKKKDLALQKKILAERTKASKLEKAAAAARKKALADEAALKRAGTVFDMDNIQIVAALQNRVTEEQRLRLTTLLAINNDNAEAADKLSRAILAIQSPALANLGIIVKSGDNATTVIAKIIDAQTKLFLLNTGIANIPKAKNPFEDWNDIMKKILSDLDLMAAKLRNMPSMGGNNRNNGDNGDNRNSNNNNNNSNNNNSNNNNNTNVTINPAGTPNAGNQPTIITPNGTIINTNPATFEVGGKTFLSNYGALSASARPDDTAMEAAARQRISDIFATIRDFGVGGYQAPTSVTVNVAGSVMTEQDLTSGILDGLYQYQKQGRNVTYNAVAL